MEPRCEPRRRDVILPTLTMVAVFAAVAYSLLGPVQGWREWAHVIYVPALAVPALAPLCLASGLLFERRRYVPLAWAGAVLAVGGLAFSLVFTYLYYADHVLAGTLEIPYRVVRNGAELLGVALLVLVPELVGSRRMVQQLTVMLLMGMWTALVFREMLGMSFYWGYFYLNGTLGVLACLGAALTAIYGVFFQVRLDPSLEQANRPVRLECPRCGLSQDMPLGHGHCTACNLRFRIEIEEPHCETCGYNLRGLQGHACPECGTSAAAW